MSSIPGADSVQSFPSDSKTITMIHTKYETTLESPRNPPRAQRQVLSSADNHAVGPWGERWGRREIHTDHGARSAHSAESSIATWQESSICWGYMNACCNPAPGAAPKRILRRRSPCVEVPEKVGKVGRLHCIASLFNWHILPCVQQRESHVHGRKYAATVHDPSRTLTGDPLRSDPLLTSRR